MPRAGIEPATHGFSGPGGEWPSPRKKKERAPSYRPPAASVQQPAINQASTPPIRPVGSRLRSAPQSSVFERHQPTVDLANRAASPRQQRRKH